MIAPRAPCQGAGNGTMALGIPGVIAPGGFEPPFSDPKSDVLPLDEGAAVAAGPNLATVPPARQSQRQ